MSELKGRLSAEMKAAMKAKEKERLKAIRSINAAIKQQEIDNQTTIENDADVITILVKMQKQRKDSLSQYEEAGREDLAEIERFELEVISEFLPQPLTEDEVKDIIEKAIAETGAASMADMGKVMGMIKPQVEGRADMGALSGQIKAMLA